jgi:hypothetical protein
MASHKGWRLKKPRPLAVECSEPPWFKTWVKRTVAMERRIPDGGLAAVLEILELCYSGACRRKGREAHRARQRMIALARFAAVRDCHERFKDIHWDDVIDKATELLSKTWVARTPAKLSRGAVEAGYIRVRREFRADPYSRDFLQLRLWRRNQITPEETRGPRMTTRVSRFYFIEDLEIGGANPSFLPLYS